MQVSSGWRTASLVAGALLLGTLIGPPLAQAASAALVRIEGAHNTHLAAVSKSGQLSVNAGLPTTPAGQLNVALANPASEVIKFIAGPGTCVGPAAVAYTIPKGKALIITAVDFYTQSQAQTQGLVHFSFLTAAPAGSDPCTHILAGAAGSDILDFQNQVFPAGIAVPAGWVLGIDDGGNEVGSIEFYGYLVPAAAVPHNVLRNVPAAVKPRL
jgi:hypothetical protein